MDRSAPARLAISRIARAALKIFGAGGSGPAEPSTRRQPGFPLPAIVPRESDSEDRRRADAAGTVPRPTVWSDPIRSPDFESALANIVNQPGLNQVIARQARIRCSRRRSATVNGGRAGPRHGVDARTRRTGSGRAEPDPRWRSAAAIGTERHPGTSGSADGVGVGTGQRNPAGHNSRN